MPRNYYGEKMDKGLDTLWQICKRMEEASTKIEKCIDTKTRHLESTITSLQVQVNKANKVISKLLQERETERAVDYDAARQINHKFERTKH